MKDVYQITTDLQAQWIADGNDPDRCRCCGACITNGLQGCYELFTTLGYQAAAYHATPGSYTYILNAHTLQHSEVHGKTNNAVHLLWLCWLFEFGGDATLPGGPPWWRGGRRSPVPVLVPPHDRGAVTVVEIAAATTPESYSALAEQWARAVYAAWHEHHVWAREHIRAEWSP